MPYKTSEDLWPPLALLVAGLLAPGLCWAVAGDLLSLYLSAVELTLLVAVGYGLVAWFLIDSGSIDQTSFLLVSLIWPWPLLFGVLILLLLFNQGEQIMRGPVADIFRELTADWPGSIFGYAAVYAGTGVAVFGLSRRYDRLARTAARLPAPIRLVPAIVALVVLLALVGAGANAVTTSAASIEHVGPGTGNYHDPTFNVSVAGPSAEYRVTVTPPDGATVTTRLSRGVMREGSGRVAIELDYDDSFTPAELPVRDGEYRVRVTSLAGLTVDTATFEADNAAGGSLRTVSLANGTPPWIDDPYSYVESRSGDVRLGFAVTNEGAFHAKMDLVVAVPDDPIVVERILVAPGERRGVVIRLAPDTVDRIQARTDGSITAELYVSGSHDEPAATVELTLPAEG